MRSHKLLPLAALFAAVAAAQPLSYTISTVAGGAPAYYFAEGKLATSFLIPSFSTPAIDRQGNFYFTMSNRVIRVGPDGKATTYAGTGVAGSSGDGGPAISALLNNPGSVLLDPQGRLLIFENFGVGTNRIRRVEVNGNISTIAGTGDPPPGPTDGDGGPATAARVHATQGAFDNSGNLFILDSAGDFSLNVRRIGMDGRITTVARQVGQYPAGMAGDGTNIYLADLNPAVNRVARLVGNAFVPITGTKVGFGGDGSPAIAASLAGPNGIAVDSAGNLHIADTGNQRIRTIRNNPAGAVASGQGIISTTAGTGTYGVSADGAAALTSQVATPAAIAIDSTDNIYVSDNGSGRFRRFRLNGTFQTVAGLALNDPLGDGGPAAQAALASPGSLYRDATGNLLIADGARLRQVSPDGSIKSILGPLPSAPGGAVRDSAGNLYILDNGMLQRIAADGTSTTILGFAGADQDEGPAAKVSIGSAQSIAIDAQDNIYIGSYRAVRKLTPAGTVTRVAGTNTFASSSLASGDARSAFILVLLGLALDANGNFFVSDMINQRILKVTPAGQFTTVAGTFAMPGFSGDGGPAALALLNHPTGLAFDAWGNLYIADQGNNRVRKITLDGTISTVAGSANTGFAGDGGPAVGAQLSIPFSQGLVTDAAGNVFLIDGNRIRQLTANKLSAQGVLHAAIQDSGALAPGLRILVRGTELIPPSSRTSLRVLFDGQPAGFVSVDGNQITTVVPLSVAGQSSTQMAVEIGGARTNALTLTVVAARPGILSIENGDGTINSTANPASGGSTITLNLTGDGGADPSLMSVAIGGAPATLVDAPPAADSGIRRVTVQLPDGASSGDPVVVSIGDANSPDGVPVWLQ